MKISELIIKLQEIQEQYGDLEYYCAIDDEGNGFNKIYYSPSVRFNIDKQEEYNNCASYEIEELNAVITEHEEDYENGIEDEDYKTTCNRIFLLRKLNDKLF